MYWASCYEHAVCQRTSPTPPQLWSWNRTCLAACFCSSLGVSRCTPFTLAKITAPPGTAMHARCGRAGGVQQMVGKLRLDVLGSFGNTRNCCKRPWPVCPKEWHMAACVQQHGTTNNKPQPRLAGKRVECRAGQRTCSERSCVATKKCSPFLSPAERKPSRGEQRNAQALVPSAAASGGLFSVPSTAAAGGRLLLHHHHHHRHHTAHPAGP